MGWMKKREGVRSFQAEVSVKVWCIWRIERRLWPEVRTRLRAGPLMELDSYLPLLICLTGCVYCWSTNRAHHPGCTLESPEELIKLLMPRNSDWISLGWDLDFIFKISASGSSHHGAVEMNPTRSHEVAALIPGLAQWVKDPVLPELLCRSANVAQICCCCCCSICQQL